MKRFLPLVAAAGLIVAACASGSPSGSSATTGEPPSTSTMPAAATGVLAALAPAGDCDALLDYFIDQALSQVGPYGLGGWGGPIVDAVAEEAATDSAGDGGQPAGGEDPTSTNVQVEGVDEGDIVKAAGDHLYVLSGQRLIGFSTAGGGLEELGSLSLGSGFGGGEMLLHGDRLVIVGTGWDVRPLVGAQADVVPPGWSFAQITLVDVSDPADPSVIRRLTFDGTVVTTRMVAGHLRVVLEAHPVGLDWSFPEGAGLRAEREATERNREIVSNSTIENWLPYYVDDRGGEGLLIDCEDVLVPPEPSGVSTLSILDFDLEGDLGSWEAASVVASGTTVYANVDRTHVATQRWIDPQTGSREAFRGHVTRIHRFDTPVDGEMTYVASGDVDGFLLNQFAMDEHEEHLRVASTSAPDWWAGRESSESQVTVLATEGNRLVEVGRVGGLGKTETIRAVRFMGPVGYVVTFRQTDPLYVIDLSDPTEPVAAGELKIPGFSAYLHPVAEGRLIGVGQDADPETGATKGLQISLFDVTDPTAPARLDTFMPYPPLDGREGHVGSPVEWDHRAFTNTDGAAFVPFEGWSWREGGGQEEAMFGVIAVSWDGDTLDGSRVLPVFEGKPGGDEWSLSPQRVVARGEVVYAVGHDGISVIDLASGEIVDTVRY